MYGWNGRENTEVMWQLPLCTKAFSSYLISDLSEDPLWLWVHSSQRPPHLQGISPCLSSTSLYMSIRRVCRGVRCVEEDGAQFCCPCCPSQVAPSSRHRSSTLLRWAAEFELMWAVGRDEGPAGKLLPAPVQVRAAMLIVPDCLDSWVPVTALINNLNPSSLMKLFDPLFFEPW